METLILISIFSLVLIGSSCAIGDAKSNVVRVVTGDFSTVLPTTKWLRKYGWMGVVKTTIEETIEITYEMELLSSSEDGCIATLRSNHLRSVLMELHTSDCSDTSDFVGIGKPKVEASIEGLPLKNVLHNIYVLMKNNIWMLYTIDSMQNLKAVSENVYDERVKQFWSECFPKQVSEGLRCTYDATSSDIETVKTSKVQPIPTLGSKLYVKWSSTMLVVDQKRNVMRNNIFMTYVMKSYYYNGRDIISIKLIAMTLNEEVLLLEIQSRYGGSTDNYVGIKEPYLFDSYTYNKNVPTRKSNQEEMITKDVIIHDITVVMKTSCLRFKITVLDSKHIITKVFTECEESIPVGSRLWTELPLTEKEQSLQF